MPRARAHHEATGLTRSPAVEDLAVEAAALELQRAVLVARMMGVAPEWASGTSAAPGWWLATWARRLAADRLTPALGTQVRTWLDRVQQVLLERETGQAADVDWLRGWLALAREVGDEGFGLEARVVAEVGVPPLRG